MSKGEKVVDHSSFIKYLKGKGVGTIVFGTTGLLSGIFALWVWSTADLFLRFSGTMTHSFIMNLLLIHIGINLVLLVLGIWCRIKLERWQLLPSGLILILVSILSLAVIIFASFIEYYNITDEFRRQYNYDPGLYRGAFFWRGAAYFGLFNVAYWAFLRGISRLRMFGKSAAYSSP